MSGLISSLLPQCPGLSAGAPLSDVGDARSGPAGSARAGFFVASFGKSAAAWQTRGQLCSGESEEAAAAVWRRRWLRTSSSVACREGGVAQSFQSAPGLCSAALYPPLPAWQTPDGDDDVGKWGRQALLRTLTAHRPHWSRGAQPSEAACGGVRGLTDSGASPAGWQNQDLPAQKWLCESSKQLAARAQRPEAAGQVCGSRPACLWGGLSCLRGPGASQAG